MRYIHPVGLNEAFVASGKYIHHQNGQPTGAFEEWAIHQLPDGARMIRVDMDARAIRGRGTLIEAWQNPDGRVERVDINAFGQADDEITQVRATYNLYPDYAEIGRTLGEGPRRYDEIQLPADYVIYPGSMLFLGFAVVQTADLTMDDPKGATILTHDPQLKADTALQPETYTQTAVNLGEETVTIGNKTFQAWHYERLIPHYDVLLPHLWVDKHGVLLRHDTPESSSHVTITNYARRPD